MHVSWLKLINFKNYAEVELDLCPGLNCFVGPNGAGKTNLLDALHYLSFTRSAVGSTDAQNIRHENSFFSIFARINASKTLHDLLCINEARKKKVFKVDDQEYERLSDHIGRFPAVMIQPTDTDLIRGGSEIRRKFFDILISQLDQGYLQSLIRYGRVLKQRNRLLKEVMRPDQLDRDLLETYNLDLLREGKAIYERRKSFLEEFLVPFRDQYKQISDHHEEVDLHYRSEMHDPDYEEKFRNNTERDLKQERTTMGIHRDDYAFLINTYPIKREGSQGQQKSFVIALKLAMFHVLDRAKGYKPMLLLDDIFDKLDDRRMAYLLDMITHEAFGQVFITDARPERTRGLISRVTNESRIFTIDEGTIQTDSNG